MADPSPPELPLRPWLTHPRLSFLGIRDDVPKLLLQHDILLDTWPKGGGATLREAATAGVPAISFETDHFSWLSNANPTFHLLNNMVHQDLRLPPELDAAVLTDLLSRLASDQAFYERVSSEAATMRLDSWRDHIAAWEEALSRLAAPNLTRPPR